MNARDYLLLSIIGTDKVPPTEFRIWNYGKVSTTKGDFKLTRVNAEKMVAAAQAHGADIPIDYDHMMARATTPDQAKAAGWFTLEARDDGLWAVNVRWTPPATAFFANSEFRYFSPNFGVERKTLEIVEITNVALTNLPATRGLQALVAASKGNTPMTIAKEELAAALTKHMKQNNVGPTEVAEQCDDKTISADRIEKLASGEGTPSDDEHRSVSKAIGYDTEGGLAGEGASAPPPEKTKPHTEKTMSMTTSTTPREALDLVALTGKSTPAEQLQVIASAIAKADAYEADHAKLESIEKHMLAEKREHLLAKGKAENKLTPKLIRLFANRSNEDLASFLEAAPAIHGQELLEVAPGDPRASLSAEDIEVAERTGRDLESKAKFIEDERSGKNRKAIEASFRVVDVPFVAKSITTPRSA